MNFFSWLVGRDCFFRHDPIKEVRGKKMYFRCRKCHQDLGIVLGKQKFKKRKEPKLKLVKFQRRERA